MLDEITKDIKATLYDRIASPFTGSLIISWIYWNWEILVVLFFMDHENLELAKNDYIKMTLITKWNILWAPLISASILTIFYPIISTGAYYIWQFFQRKKRVIKINSEDKVPLDIEESIELRLQMRKMQETFHESNQSSASQILDLENENNDLKQQIEKNKSEYGNLQNMKNSLREIKSELALSKKELNQTTKVNKEFSDEIRTLSVQNDKLQSSLNKLNESNKFLFKNLNIKSDLRMIHFIKGNKNQSLESYEINHIEKLVSMDLVRIVDRKEVGKYPVLTEKSELLLKILNTRPNDVIVGNP